MNESLLDTINAINREGRINLCSHNYYYSALGLSDGTIVFVGEPTKQSYPVQIPKCLNYFCESFFGNHFTYQDFKELCLLITWSSHDSNSFGILPYSSFEQFLNNKNLLDVFIKNKPKKSLSLF